MIPAFIAGKSRKEAKERAEELLAFMGLSDRASHKPAELSGDRSAKIRTYNFPQGRVTDHRIGYTTHDLNGFLAGNIQDMIDALTVAENAEKLLSNLFTNPFFRMPAKL